MSLSDEEFRLRTRHARAGRRPGRARAPDAPVDGAALPEVVEMVGKWVRAAWPDGHDVRVKVKDQVVCGDRVVIEDDLVVAHAPRRTELRRGGNSGIRVVCANADVLLIVTATQDPPFRTGLVDRMLVAASAAGMEAAIVLNKCDSGMPEEVLDSIARYEALGVPAFLVSAALGKGFEPLQAALVGKTGVLAGHSGVAEGVAVREVVADVAGGRAPVRRGVAAAAPAAAGARTQHTAHPEDRREPPDRRPGVRHAGADVQGLVHPSTARCVHTAA